MTNGVCENISLYKNRYIVAVYDSVGERFLGVFDNPKEMSAFFGVENMGITISKYKKKYGTFPLIKWENYSFYFIDIYEEHQDQFKEEDDLFLEFYEENRPQTISAFCKSNNIATRGFYYKKKLLCKGELNEQVKC